MFLEKMRVDDYVSHRNQVSVWVARLYPAHLLSQESPLAMVAHSRVKNFVRFNEAALPHFLYLFIVLLVALLSLVSVVFLLSQAVRTAPNRNWTKNVNVIVIGAAYVLVVCPGRLNRMSNDANT